MCLFHNDYVLTLHAEPANFEANEAFSIYSTGQVDARER